MLLMTTLEANCRSLESCLNRQPVYIIIELLLDIITIVKDTHLGLNLLIFM